MSYFEARVEAPVNRQAVAATGQAEKTRGCRVCESVVYCEQMERGGDGGCGPSRTEVAVRLRR